MFSRKGSMYVPLNTKFVVTILLIDFVLVVISFLELQGYYPEHPDFGAVFLSQPLGYSLENWELRV